jgi:multiple sugar transport system ATP-binding protein
VAGFIGSPKMNFLRTSVIDAHETTVTVALPGGAELQVPVEPGHLRGGAPVTLGIRPEHVRLGDGGPLRGEVLVVERLGGTTFLHVQAEGGAMLTVEVGGEDPVRMHDAVGLVFEREDCHLFDASGIAVPRASRHPLAAPAPRSAGSPGPPGPGAALEQRGDGGAQGAHH